MFDTIVVPVGYLDDVGLAVAHGAALAAQAGAALELLTVQPAYVAETEVRRHLARIAECQGIGADANLHIAPPADPAGFITMVGTTEGTLLCMQTHARLAVGELVLGSVSEQVVRACRRPVLLVGPRCGAPPARHESIVVAVDGTGFAEHIVPTVQERARALGITPWLFEVLHAHVPFEAGRDDIHESSYVENLTHELAAQGTETFWDTAHDRHPALAIARFAEVHQPSLVALTTHGRSPIERVALGSVAFTVTHQATVPVLVLRPDAAGSDA